MNPYLEIDNDILVRECLNGNQDALGLFYTRFAPRMHSVIKRYVADPNDAKDILHDGFIVAFTRLKDLRNHDTLEYWLATIMKNLSLQFLQAQSVDKVLHDIPEVEDTPEFDDIIDLPVLESLIQKLPKGYQSVFRLSVLEHKTHKEIAKILGIAPNSSSSQLFHAKMMMRKLVTEYRHKTEMLSILLIALTAGTIWWINTDNTTVRDMAISITPAFPENTSSGEKWAIKTVEEKSSFPQPPKPHRLTYVDSHLKQTAHEYAPTDCIYDTDAHEPNLTQDRPTPIAVDNDTTITEEQSEEMLQDQLHLPTLPASNNEEICRLSSKHRDWSLKIGVNARMTLSNFSSDNYDYAYDTNWPTIPPDDTTEENTSEQQTASRSDNDYMDTAHCNDIPVTVSATINKPLSNIFGVETGLTYTYLHTTLENGKNSSDCRWHYLGVPLKLTISNYSNKNLRLYATVGAQLDVPLLSTATSSGNSIFLPYGKFNSPIVWSVGASYGLNINISKHMGIFIEPTVQYHFNHDYNVPNAWTDNKIVFSIPIGLRCNF